MLSTFFQSTKWYFQISFYSNQQIQTQRLVIDTQKWKKVTATNPDILENGTNKHLVAMLLTWNNYLILKIIVDSFPFNQWIDQQLQLYQTVLIVSHN